MNKQGILKIFLLMILFMPAPVFSANAWYRGVVNRVALVGADGSFIVTFSNAVLSDCAWSYANFYVSELGAERVKMSYAMAITSLTTGRSMGIVIDKDRNAPGGNCFAAGMTADLR